MVCAFEQRRSQRTQVNWPVSVWHPKASRFFNGYSVNISAAGALVVLPLRAPVSQGHNIEINFPRSENLARDKGECARIKSARVVRIDRTDSVDKAAVKVALEFCDQVEPEPAMI